MSDQILLYGKLLGIEEFLLSGEDGAVEGSTDRAALRLLGRSHWVTLLGETLPRALLEEFGLARILLGSSGGAQFLLVLPGEVRAQADEFLAAAGRQMLEMSGGHLKLAWAATENLGEWSVVRKRINEELHRALGADARNIGPAAFTPFTETSASAPDGYFEELGAKLWQAESVGWNPESPARIALGAGKHTWSLIPNRGGDDIPLARHAAPSEDGSEPASLEALASRAEGRKAWGVLRGDVDSFRIRLRRAQTIEEHVRLSVLYKQFFAGELEVLCSLPEFWRKVSIIYSGGDDFAVYGSWDTLIALAREVQRLFHRFTEENLKEYPGAEGKTISMAIALAPETYFPLATVYEEAGRNLDLAKAAGKDCIYLLGRILEWRHLNDAADLKDTVTRLIHDFRMSRQFLYQLRSFYRRDAYGGGTDLQRTWRFQRRFNRILSGTRDREFQKLRTHLISEMAGRKSAEVKLRPAGLVALEWARLVTEV
jgi:CRISPR-associated protein Csm1